MGNLPGGEKSALQHCIHDLLQISSGNSHMNAPPNRRHKTLVQHIQDLHYGNLWFCVAGGGGVPPPSCDTRLVCCAANNALDPSS